ncbi:uncharacterized protein FYW49_006405 [Xenentodon cancila]
MDEKTGKQTLQLVVQAPVSSVLLVSECLSEGQMKVSCSSDGGDSPQYSWTLDGHTLTDSELLSGAADTNIIILKQNVSGRLVCSVRNHISRVSNETILTTCGFIFINCISNGTQISKWVFKENNTLCTEPTTVATTVGGETHCDGRQDGVQCFGALGGTLVLQLMDNASEMHRYQWKKEETIILHGRKNKIITNKLDSRSVFIPSNGTFLINNLIRTDSGQYTLEVVDSDGQTTGKQTLQLVVEAPVSSVLLVSECLSEGQMKVSCSSDGGDSPQYSWTLDGLTLTDSELLSGAADTNIIILKQNVSGRLVCSVRNHISRVSKEQMISVCRDLSLLRCALMAVVAVVSFVGIGIYFKWKKTKYKEVVKLTVTADRMEFSVLELWEEPPVSSVLLVSECLSEGQMKVSCSSDGGDSPQYSWTLDGHTLTDSELLSGAADTNIIILKQNVSGRLVCSVRNHISRVSNETILTTCGFIFINCISNGTQISKWVFKENNTLCTEPTTVATTVGKETESFKPTINTSSNQTMTPSTEEPWYFKKEDDQELSYVNVRVVEQRSEEEVEYALKLVHKQARDLLAAPLFVTVPLDNY